MKGCRGLKRRALSKHCENREKNKNDIVGQYLQWPELLVLPVNYQINCTN